MLRFRAARKRLLAHRLRAPTIAPATTTPSLIQCAGLCCSRPLSTTTRTPLSATTPLLQPTLRDDISRRSLSSPSFAFFGNSASPSLLYRCVASALLPTPRHLAVTVDRCATHYALRPLSTLPHATRSFPRMWPHHRRRHRR
jgi:hypothetical protein